MLGQKIGTGSKVRFGTLLLAKQVQLGDGVSIGPFCYVKAESLILGDYSCIKALSIVSTRIVRFGKYVHIAPLAIITSEFTEHSIIEIGDHSRVFPYSWLDTGEGIRIGKQSSVGTHTLIYTHGTWADYLNGAPIAYGPVTIEDHVWIPTRVTILPNVVIGEHSIIGASSLINKSVPKNVLIAGTPARIIRENITSNLDTAQKLDRAREILKAFSNYINYKRKLHASMTGDLLDGGQFRIALDNAESLKQGDLLMLVNKNLTTEEEQNLMKQGISVISHNQKTVRLAVQRDVYTDFIAYLRRYGIRLYIFNS
jgi:acetyltransferase-like isoleucine patch superfamily enzyme